MNRKLPTLTIDEIIRYNGYRMQLSVEKCWPWMMSSVKDGYGTFSYRSQTFLSHRLAYFIFHNIDPGDKLVCHDCDNPPCCNPNHLWLGDAKENQRDALIKGRRSDSKLTESIVLSIRETIDTGTMFKVIAAEFNVSPMVISRVHRRAIWSHI